MDTYFHCDHGQLSGRYVIIQMNLATPNVLHLRSVEVYSGQIDEEKKNPVWLCCLQLHISVNTNMLLIDFQKKGYLILLVHYKLKRMVFGWKL